MGYYVKVVEDTLAPNKRRGISLEMSYPRFIHSEVLTHRDRARNSSSSRAIPWPVMCSKIRDDAVVPLAWVREQKGMMGGLALTGEDAEKATKIWLKLRDNAVYGAQELADLGIHKSLCNRVTEPWMWITTIMTATQWKHFLLLRAHPEAEQHFQHLGRLIINAIKASKPKKLKEGEWHLPYVVEEDYDECRKYAITASRYSAKTCQLINKHYENGNEILKMISVARCARVSIVSPGEVKRNIQKDLETFDRLHCGSKMCHSDSMELLGGDQLDHLPHISPFEHQLMALSVNERDSWMGCVKGYKQYRKEFKNEYIEDDYPSDMLKAIQEAGID